MDSRALLATAVVASVWMLPAARAGDASKAEFLNSPKPSHAADLSRRPFAPATTCSYPVSSAIRTASSCPEDWCPKRGRHCRTSRAS